MSHLDAIALRKRREVERRLRHPRPAARRDDALGARALSALRRPAGAGPRVIAEIKRRSPSKGVIRPREIGDVARIARAYEAAGAAAVSVLADGPGFGGTPLDVRRAAAAVRAPILFKEIVLAEPQVELARAMGASLVLLVVRAVDDAALHALVHAVEALGMRPVVEVATEAELDRALATPAEIVGVNARDLGTFEVDEAAALWLVERIPRQRVAVFMSGIADREGYLRVAVGRADAVLVGEGLMRAPDPGDKLREILGTMVFHLEST